MRASTFHTSPRTKHRTTPPGYSLQSSRAVFWSAVAHGKGDPLAGRKFFRIPGSSFELHLSMVRALRCQAALLEDGTDSHFSVEIVVNSRHFQGFCFRNHGVQTVEILQDVDGVFKSLGAVVIAASVHSDDCWSWHHIQVTTVVKESCYRFQIRCAALADFVQSGGRCDLMSMSAVTAETAT